MSSQWSEYNQQNRNLHGTINTRHKVMDGIEWVEKGSQEFAVEHLSYICKMTKYQILGMDCLRPLIAKWAVFMSRLVYKDAFVFQLRADRLLLEKWKKEK